VLGEKFHMFQCNVGRKGDAVEDSRLVQPQPVPKDGEGSGIGEGVVEIGHEVGIVVYC
jgi:hypothetical protein